MNPPIRHIDTAEVARLVRRRLAATFPGIRFSVRTSRYSGGSSIHIHWTDGPASDEVDAITKPYEGQGFDASIDLSYRKEQWLLPDGTVQLAASQGTTGSMGQAQEYVSDAPHPQAELVRMGASYVFADREVSDFDARIAEAEALVRERCAITGTPPRDSFGNYLVTDHAQRIVYSQRQDEPLEKAFRRVVLREED